MEKKDFFISYNSADVVWAEWIASVLVENNYTVIIQAWDFRPGDNFVVAMHNAASTTEKTIIVLSEHYLQAEYTQPEWATAFSEDPQGKKRKLIPVRIEECRPSGLLRPIVHINIFNLPETIAEVTLLNGIKQDVRPKTRTRFPGGEKIGEKKCLQNLIHRDFQSLIGRKKELKKLLKCISPNERMYIIEVDGIGGLGKTALVLEAAYLCKEAKESKQISLNQEIPVFDAIIYTSAKTSSLESTGICYKSPEVQDKCLQDIFNVIATTLNSPIITQETAKNQLSQVYKCLANQKTLLIIDNMETLEPSEKKEIYSFLKDLPPTTKAIITTRERLGYSSSINLKELSKTYSLQLIKQEANAQGIKINKQNIDKIYSRFQGIPLALKYTVGKIAKGWEIDFDKPIDKDIAFFCFEGSVLPLRGQDSYKLLRALAFFQDDSSKANLIEVAGLSTKSYDAVDEELTTLKTLNLINEDSGRYHMLTMTKEYTKFEIQQDSDFENAARERLIKLYINFTAKNGGLDWEQWLINSKKIEQELKNIKGLLDWCAKNDRYDEIKTIWSNISNYIDLSGDWRLFLYWTDWLIEQSDMRSDLDTYIRLKTNKAWILILMGGNKLNEAQNLLKEAWKFRNCANLHVRIEIAKSLGVLELHLENYSCSMEWFEQAEEFLNQANLSNKEYIRFKILFAYYRGRIEYFKHNYDVAQKFFQEAVELGEEISWQRYSNYAEHRLGDVALKMGDLSPARQLLEKARLIAEKNSEPRRVYLCLMSLAKLEDKSKNHKKACEILSLARKYKSYNSVSTRDEEEYKILCDELRCEFPELV